MNRLKQLIVEIHRRSLWQVLLIYVGAALMAYQAVQALTEGLGLPQWFPALAIVLFIIGLPIVLATAFVHEVAPPAVRPAEAPLVTEAEAAPTEVEAAALRQEARRRYRLLTWRNAAGTFVIALAAWGVVATGWLLLAGRTEREPVGVAEVARRSIAVLPFVNLSPDPENEFFADGMHDEVITQLAKIADLKVISRTSVMEYKGRSENLRAIAQELGVTNVLEGTVRRADGRVRITTQLIDALADEHLWAEVYDRDLSDVFAVQSDVAQQVATALRATLTPAERGRIEERPTENLEAYDYYLQGLEYMGRPGIRPEDYQNAERMLERAVELDPRFALAYARLSYNWATAYEFADRSEERLRHAREAADRALEIDPGLPEGHVALGYYYYAVRDLDRALEELAIAERGLPGSTTLLFVRGWVLTRQGKWDEALASLERALALNPRSTGLLARLGSTYFSLRRYEEAEACYDRALAFHPDFFEAAWSKAWVALSGRGDTRALRTVLEGAPPDPWGLATWSHLYVNYLDRDYAAALEVLSHSHVEFFEYTGQPRTLFMAMCFAAMGESDRAQAAADSARRDLEARLGERPDAPELHSSLSWAHAYLGHREDAIREAQRAVQLMPISRDAVDGPYWAWNLGTIYAWFGEVDAAVEQFDRYLSVPAPESVRFLLLQPEIDRVRDHPRFRALVEKYER